MKKQNKKFNKKRCLHAKKGNLKCEQDRTFFFFYRYRYYCQWWLGQLLARDSLWPDSTLRPPLMSSCRNEFKQETINTSKRVYLQERNTFRQYLEWTTWPAKIKPRASFRWGLEYLHPQSKVPSVSLLLPYFSKKRYPQAIRFLHSGAMPWVRPHPGGALNLSSSHRGLLPPQSTFCLSHLTCVSSKPPPAFPILYLSNCLL